jgi:hypothetical protein
MNTQDQERKQEVLKFSEKLRSAGIAKVSVSYSGCGDEGRSEEPQLQNLEAQPIDRWSLPIEIDIEQLGELLEDFAPTDYEDGDGGFGTVTFDIESGTIRIEHCWYETVSREDEPREF